MFCATSNMKKWTLKQWATIIPHKTVQKFKWLILQVQTVIWGALFNAAISLLRINSKEIVACAQNYAQNHS